jgi:sugar-specific transcriptional regulator TrmB
MIENIFNEFGLTKYETKVYLALTELGEATSGQILNKAGINSGKIYQILESLKNKGFVSEITKNNVKKYFSVEPSEILGFFKKKRKKIDKQEKVFKEILPELMNKINQRKEKIHIEIFTGIQGMKKAFDKEVKLYKKGKCLRINGITNYNKHPKKFIDYFQYNLFPIREKSQIQIKKISDKQAKSNVHEKGAKIRFLEYNSIITFNNIGNLTIKSQETAEGFLENFELLWKIAKKP